MIFYRRKIFLFVSVFILGLNLSATGEGQSLTIEGAVSLALKNNISIRQSHIQLDAAKRAKNTAWNSVSPSLTGSAGVSKSNRDFSENYSAYIQGAINFSFSTNLYTDIKNAALKYQAGELSYESACRAVELAVRKSFYNLLYEKDSITLQENNAETARLTYETNRRKYAQGAISQLDVLSSQVNYESILPTLQNARITYQNSLASFKQTLGLDQDEEIQLEGSLDSIAEIESVPVYEGQGTPLELAVLEKNLELAKNSLLASRFSAYGPTLSAGWTYRPTWTDSTDGMKDNGALSLSVSIPLDGLLPWSAKANSIAGAKDSIADYELLIQDKKTGIQVETESAKRKIGQLIQSIQTLKAGVSLAEESYQMTQEAYNRGSRNWTELLTARNSLERSRLNLKQQAYNLAEAILNLENTLGVPFGSLTENQ